MTEAVLFDLDGTLFDRDAAVAGILAWQVRTFSAVLPPSRAAEFCRRVTDLDEHGHRDKRDVYATIATEFGFAPAVVDELVVTFWSEYPRHWVLGAGVADKLGVVSAQCCFVGDHPDVDVAGAEAAGMRAIWKRTAYWAPAVPIPTIGSIPELLSLL